MRRNRIRLTESQLCRVIKESVKKVLKESTAYVKDEVEELVNELGSSIEEWYGDNIFVDKHGCNGYVYASRQEAIDNVLNGDEHQNAVDFVDGAQTDEEWIEYLVHGGVNRRTAMRIINAHDWDKVVKIIVAKEGPEWFLSSYSGEVHPLSNGMVLYY